MKKPEEPTPGTWTPEVEKHVQGYLECMTARPWTQGASTHEVVRHPDGYHVFDCHHGRDGQGSAYIVNAMPAALARIRELEGALRPFADAFVGLGMDDAAADSWGLVDAGTGPGGDAHWAIAREHFRRAARALKGGA